MSPVVGLHGEVAVEVALATGQAGDVAPQVDGNLWSGSGGWGSVGLSSCLAVGHNAHVADVALIGSPPELEVPEGSPAESPGVLDQPVLLAPLLAPSDNQDCMVALLVPENIRVVRCKLSRTYI